MRAEPRRLGCEYHGCDGGVEVCEDGFGVLRGDAFAKGVLPAFTACGGFRGIRIGGFGGILGEMGRLTDLLLDAHLWFDDRIRYHVGIGVGDLEVYGCEMRDDLIRLRPQAQ